MADEARRKPAGMDHRRWRGGGPGAEADGGRLRLGEALVRELLVNFERDGRGAIEKLREERPLDYLRVVVEILRGDLPEGRRRAIVSTMVGERVLPRP